jgi:luciferase family oxidoreductase group 1
MSELLLSVLDQSPIRSGGTAAEALEESVELARQTEKLGYHRFWVAEHHASNSFAGCSPEILLTRIATETSRIRVGSGGVMLPHYSPYKVAENFQLLQTMFPGRIDLGIGRAPGSDMLTSQALGYGSPIGIEYFPNKVADLAAFIENRAPQTKGLERVKVMPRPLHSPQLWMLGSSQQSALSAAHFGLPYSFAHFINPSISQEMIKLYMRDYKPSEMYPTPRANLGIFVLCAESEEDVENLAICRDLWRLRFETGDPGPCPSIEEAKSYPFTKAQQERLAAQRSHMIYGTPANVKQQLKALAEDNHVNELVIITICHDFNARVRSYELIAEEFGINTLHAD